MLAALYTIYYINSFFLILVVLLQSGRGGGLGEFGGGAAPTTTFGTRGTSSILQQLTVYSAIGFMALSLTIAILSSRQHNVGQGQIVAEEQMDPGVSGAAGGDISDADDAPVDAGTPQEEPAAQDQEEAPVQDDAPAQDEPAAEDD